jgi:hypothetical protein
MHWFFAEKPPPGAGHLVPSNACLLELAVNPVVLQMPTDSLVLLAIASVIAAVYVTGARCAKTHKGRRNRVRTDPLRGIQLRLSSDAVRLCLAWALCVALSSSVSTARVCSATPAACGVPQGAPSVAAQLPNAGQAKAPQGCRSVGGR